ncbi:hypothetical protein ACFPYJ_01700 [Paenibacillus solisilvae]|uniref:Translocation protein TolB n=1 Tax=Paenibacillus solisilvae TaxID=2486751 RepID=A0ABW0VSJ3_9BACL
MYTLRKVLLVFGVVLSMACYDASRLSAAPSYELKAAFVRGGDLWMKNGDKETPLTKGEQIRNPKWSSNGRWIAHTRGQDEQELWVIDIQTGESILVSADGGGRGHFAWAPGSTLLAFQSEQRLYWVDLLKPERVVEAAVGIDNFSWYPDGQGFLASSETDRIPPDSWSPVRILKIPLNKPGDPSAVETLFVLPLPSDKFFAVGTSIFKWSADGRWIAFLATPTASLSADGNYLCLLSADGQSFQSIDQMANNELWFNWSPQGTKLAYIGGVGREATSNKRLMVTELPSAAGTAPVTWIKPISYTPTGYVDQNFTWQGNRHIVVSRAQELQQWSSDPASRPFPSLVNVNLGNRRHQQLTEPSKTYGDYQPLAVPIQRLIWVRSDRQKASVMFAAPNPAYSKVWIAGIDLGTNFYEQWNWNPVLSVYEPVGFK